MDRRWNALNFIHSYLHLFDTSMPSLGTNFQTFLINIERTISFWHWKTEVLKSRFTFMFLNLWIINKSLYQHEFLLPYQCNIGNPQSVVPRAVYFGTNPRLLLKQMIPPSHYLFPPIPCLLSWHQHPCSCMVNWYSLLSFFWLGLEGFQQLPHLMVRLAKLAESAYGMRNAMCAQTTVANAFTSLLIQGH